MVGQTRYVTVACPSGKLRAFGSPASKTLIVIAETRQQTAYSSSEDVAEAKKEELPEHMAQTWETMGWAPEFASEDPTSWNRVARD